LPQKADKRCQLLRGQEAGGPAAKKEGLEGSFSPELSVIEGFPTQRNKIAVDKAGKAFRITDNYRMEIAIGAFVFTKWDVDIDTHKTT